MQEAMEWVTLKRQQAACPKVSESVSGKRLVEVCP
jgi:hypothetical protein